MISPELFINSLVQNELNFFTGVPDSLLKHICAYITDHIASNSHIVAANEGAAIGLAVGYHLATNKIPVVYMQNSGIGNSINPLLSLVDKEVYNIPLLVLVGWRGEPGVKDEPQHIKQGKVTIPLFDSMRIKNQILSKDKSDFLQQLNVALEYIRETNEPFVFIIQKETFSDYKLQTPNNNALLLDRETAIKIIVSSISKNDIVVSTTGMISRELFEYRDNMGESHEKDFLTVGSMGHASQIALGIALQKKARTVYCFDGDGAVLMHMGGLTTIGSIKPSNYIHVLFNNGAHDSVGGQPTVGFEVDFTKIALACGYKYALVVESASSLNEVIKTVNEMQGPVFLEVKVKKGARKDLGRPTITPIQNKDSFMDFLKR